MNNRIGKFNKVSYEQFKKDYTAVNGVKTPSKRCLNESVLRSIYDDIKLPKRATVGSAGYDIYSIIDFSLVPQEEIILPTGICVEMEEGWVLQCFPRSGLGFKYRLQLNNTVGIIDRDYVYSDNEGHIFIKLKNDSEHESGKIVNISKGQAFVQGIFLPHGLTIDDEVAEVRNGGFGSTSK